MNFEHDSRCTRVCSGYFEWPDSSSFSLVIMRAYIALIIGMVLLTLAVASEGSGPEDENKDEDEELSEEARVGGEHGISDSEDYVHSQVMLPKAFV